MATARDSILGAIRQSLARGPLAGPRAEVVRQRLARPRPVLVPERARGTPAERVCRFIDEAERAGTELRRLSDATPATLSAAMADLLAGAELTRGTTAEGPAAEAVGAVVEVGATRDPRLDGLTLPPGFVLTCGVAGPATRVGIAVAEAALAETGTLVLWSDPGRPASLTVLPDLHVVVVFARDVLGGLEEAWARLRSQRGFGFAPPPGVAPTAAAGTPADTQGQGTGEQTGPLTLPRTLHLVTGPSRTGDIEQTLQLGAHGPLRLVVLLVDDPA